jgi:hypothetical protein
MENKIEFTRINNDANGNPRYVCHFLNLIKSDEKFVGFSEQYDEAVRRAKKIGGKRYHTKSYGGGIVFQSYNIQQTEQDILNLLK